MKPEKPVLSPPPVMPNKNDNPAIGGPSYSQTTSVNDKLAEVLKKHWAKIFAAIALLILLGVGVNTCSRPSIKTFSASSSNVKRGEKVKLTWETVKASLVTLNGAKVALSGSTDVTPTETRPYSYELRAKNDYGGKQKHIVVTVLPAPAPTVKFWAEPEQVEKNQTAVLYWETTGATEVRLNHGKVGLSGHQDVKANATQKYTLVAQNEDGEKAESVTLKVVPTPDPGDPSAQMSFKATRNPIRSGQETTLLWDTGTVKNVELKQGDQPPQKVTPKGEVKVSPSTTTRYALTGYPATGPPITKTVNIRIASSPELIQDTGPKPPVLSPTPDKGSRAKKPVNGGGTKDAATFTTNGASVEAEVVSVDGFTYVFRILGKEYTGKADIHTNKMGSINSGDLVSVRADNGRILEIIER